MMKRKLKCGIVVEWDDSKYKGNYPKGEFGTKFQIEVDKLYGINSSESIALWCDGDLKKIEIYFSTYSAIEFQKILSSAESKLKGIKKITL